MDRCLAQQRTQRFVRQHPDRAQRVVRRNPRKGVELARRKDPAKADALQSWLEAVVAVFGDRVLPVDRSVADEWGRMSALRPIPVIDGLLAATARVHDFTLVTRNAADVAGLGAKVLDPFLAK